MIRLKVFIPTLLLVALVGFIVFFRLEAWVKVWIENGISAITETKTDIHALHLSFKNASLEIDRLEITSRDDNMVNLAEFEDIKLDFQVLPLLKKRFVIDEFSVRGIQWGTKRTKPGILPPRKESSKPSWLSEEMDKALGSLKTEISKTPVGRLTDFHLPDDPRDIVKDLNFESEKAFTSMVEHSQRLRGEWVERYKTLRDTTEYERRAHEIKGFVTNPPNNPESILKAIQVAQDTQSFFEGEKKKIEDLTTAVKTDYQNISSEYAKAEKALRTDIERAQKLVNLDDLNVNHLSKLLFGDVWVSRAEEVLRLHAMLRHFLVAKPAGEGIEVKQRARGRDIVFVTEKKEPTFVWAKSDFSVKGLKNGNRKEVTQLYEVKVRDINSSPRLYGKPTTIDLNAELKESLLEKATFAAKLDYTKKVDDEEFKATAQGFKIDHWNLGIPKLFPIVLSQGAMGIQSDLHFEGDDFLWATKLSFAKAAWDFSDVPNRGILVPILQDIFRNVNDFYLTIKMENGPKGFDFGMESNMDSQIKAGIDAQLEKKLNELQARLKREVETRVDAYRQKASDEMNRFTNEVQKKAQDLSGQLQLNLGEAKKVENDLKNRSQKAIQSKMGDGLKDIQKNLPKLPIPFKLGQ